MLVLSRKKFEEVVITLEDGREIELCVVDIRGDKIRLGISADTAIKVHRKEIADLIKAQNATVAR